MLTFVAVFAVPTFAADKKNDKNAPPPVPTADSDTLPPGNFTGKLKSPPGSDGSFVVAVEYQHLVLKPANKLPKNPTPQLQAVIKDQAKVAQLQTKVATAKTAKGQVTAMQQLQAAMAIAQLHLAAIPPQQSPYNVQTDTKDVTFHAAETVKVRFTQPPSAFDEKGNPKKYTADELKELKGTGADAKLIGYAGSIDKLTSGMPVRVTTIANKPKKEEKKPDDKSADPEKKADADAAKKDPADPEKKADADTAAVKKDPADPKDPTAPKDPTDTKDPGPKTVVSLILVYGDESSGDPPTTTTDPKKKKKNN
jgi:hypothetical protein